MNKQSEPWHEYAERKNKMGLHWTVEPPHQVQNCRTVSGRGYIVVWDGIVQIGGGGWRWWLGITPPYEYRRPGLIGGLFGETWESRLQDAIDRAATHIWALKKTREHDMIRRGAFKTRWRDQ